MPVLPGDDETTLAARVLAQEHVVYPRAVRWLVEGRAVLRDGQVIVKEAEQQGEQGANRQWVVASL